MKSKAILVFLLAILSVLAVQMVSASNLVDFKTVSISGEPVGTNQTIAVFAGETLPIRVSFTALEDERDVRVKAWISGYRRDTSSSTERFDILEGGKYTQLFSLRMPDDIDPTEGYTLYLRVESKTQNDEVSVPLRLQRESYTLEVLTVQTPQRIQAGSVFPVSVVLKNRGMHELEDIFVNVRIDSLGLEKQIYAGDLVPEDVCEDCDDDDASEAVVYLQLPSDTPSGVYNLEVEAFNVDSSTRMVKSIVVEGGEGTSDVLVPVTSKNVASGEEVTYDLILVNSGERMRIYTFNLEGTNDLTVNIEEPIVSVPADSTRVVKVRVRPTDEEGTFAFAVNVNSDGELVRKVNLATNVEDSTVTATSPAVVLTVILVIIFVVLLIVLIILLTRRPMRTEELGESYY